MRLPGPGFTEKNRWFLARQVSAFAQVPHHRCWNVRCALEIEFLQRFHRRETRFLKLDNDKPSLLVATASLLANWAAELERFAPSLKVMVAHTSAMSSDSLKTLSADSLADVDVVIASYGTLLRIPWLTET